MKVRANPEVREALQYMGAMMMPDSSLVPIPSLEIPILTQVTQILEDMGGKWRNGEEKGYFFPPSLPVRDWLLRLFHGETLCDTDDIVPPRLSSHCSDTMAILLLPNEQTSRILLMFDDCGDILNALVNKHYTGSVASVVSDVADMAYLAEMFDWGNPKWRFYQMDNVGHWCDEEYPKRFDTIGLIPPDKEPNMPEAYAKYIWLSLERGEPWSRVVSTIPKRALTSRHKHAATLRGQLQEHGGLTPDFDQEHALLFLDKWK